VPCKGNNHGDGGEIISNLSVVERLKGAKMAHVLVNLFLKGCDGGEIRNGKTDHGGIL